MQSYRNIFIILTYINSKDLIEFLESAKVTADDYKVIIVNSYHDDESKEKIEKIAYNNGCDFINVENRGYSYGNNCGIQYAMEHYKFEFITVSNADIIIKKYKTKGLPKDGIFSGVLIARSGKNQNPMTVKENILSEKLIYQGFKYRKKIKLFLGIGLNKIRREIFLFKNKNMRSISSNPALKPQLVRIFQPHGSFITFSINSIKKLWNGNDFNYTGVFDENMFLFSEEGVLAKRAKKLNIPIYYSNYAFCYHKEDGSMKLADLDLNGELAKSNIYFYEHYCKK